MSLISDWIRRRRMGNKYVVDRVEDGVLVLQNLKTRKMSEVYITSIPFLVLEGDVLTLTSDGYIKDIEETENRKNRIREKMEKLKR